MAARELRVYHIADAGQEYDDALHAVRLDGIAAFFRAAGFGHQVGRDERAQMVVYLPCRMVPAFRHQLRDGARLFQNGQQQVEPVAAANAGEHALRRWLALTSFRTQVDWRPPRENTPM